MANRRRQWQDFHINEVTLATEEDFAGLLQGDVDDTKGMTLVRMVIRLSFTADPRVASGVDQMVMAMGIGMVSSEAIASGNFPNANLFQEIPLTGWMWKYRVTVSNSAESAIVRVDADIRSQRKVMYGSPVLLLANNLVDNTPFTIITTGLIRCLYLLE